MSDERGSSRLVHVSSSPATLSARVRWIGWAVAVLALYWWSAEGTRLNVYSLLEGLHGVGDIFVRMFPPRLDVLPKLFRSPFGGLRWASCSPSPLAFWPPRT